MKGIISKRKQRLFVFFYFCFYFYFYETTSVSAASRSAATATISATSRITTEITANNSIKKSYKFAMVPKNIDNPFFDDAHKGCEDKARTITTTNNNNNIYNEYFNISCVYKGPKGDNAEEQVAIIDELINMGDIDGIAIAVSSSSMTTTRAIDRATAAGIPVITYDSDSPNSTRLAYVGTNNTAFGIELGKVLDQIAPEGGTYGLIAAKNQNVKIRADGVIHRLNQKDSNWIHVEGMGSPLDCEDNTNIALQRMYELANNPKIDAIIPVGAWPMMNESGWKYFVDNTHHRLKLVVGDTMPLQIELMNKAYANGLVGQQAYKMGEMSVDTLLQIVQQQGTFAADASDNNNKSSSEIYGTSLLEYLEVPLDLPDVVLDDNYLGKLVILGYVYFTIVALVVLGCGVWLVVNRKQRVVYASQPPFLCMVCVGALVLGSTILPLTVNTQRYTEHESDAACMAIPWLFSIGFTTTFAALFSKLWRVNRLFRNPKSYKRMKVEAKDVIIPYLILLGFNLVVLLCWTLISPLMYIRRDNLGTDGWNRIISRHGVCSAPEEELTTSIVCTSILVVLNFVVLILANHQAYQVRFVQTEFSESSYIAIIMASMLQAYILGTPILFLVYRDPQAFFVVASTLIFMTCLSVLLFIFVPKILYLRSKKKDGDTRVTVSSGFARQSQNDDVDRRMRFSFEKPVDFDAFDANNNCNNNNEEDDNNNNNSVPDFRS